MAFFTLMMLLILFMTTSPVLSLRIKSTPNGNALCLSYGNSTTKIPKVNMEVTTEICDPKDPRQNSWRILNNVVHEPDRNEYTNVICLRAIGALCYAHSMDSDGKIRNYLETLREPLLKKRRLTGFQLPDSKIQPDSLRNRCIESVAAGKGPINGPCDYLAIATVSRQFWTFEK